MCDSSSRCHGFVWGLWYFLIILIIFGGSVVVDSSFIAAPIACGLFGLCFVVKYLVSFLFLQSSHWGIESCLLYFNCLLDVLWLFKQSHPADQPMTPSALVPLVDLQCVIVAFPGHTHLPFGPALSSVVLKSANQS